MLSAEQLEIAEFLALYPPFNALPEEALQQAAHQLEIAYFRAGSEILALGAPINDLFMIRSGAVEICKRDGTLYNRMETGGLFGQLSLMMNRRVRYPARALEDTLLYCLPVELFNDYCDRYDEFADFFTQQGGELLRQVNLEQADNNDLTTVKVSTLLNQQAVLVPPQASVREVAHLMAEQQVSAVLVAADPDADLPSLLGILTERDLSRRVIAEGLPASTEVAGVMTTDLISIDDQSYVFEAMLTMLRYNIHHLPVVRRQRPVGILGLAEILLHDSQSSLLLVRGIFAQQSVDDLAEYAQQLPAVFIRMVNEDANFHMIGSAMAVIGRSIKQRLLELAETTFGPPPVPYCLLALGSMARDEQLLLTDQDNALILSDRYQPAQHAEYFEQLARFVCDGLNACGYSYCNGDVMATNPAWRKTFSEWQQQFEGWIAQPNPQALLDSSIFFDLDGVAGQVQWASALQRLVAERASNNKRFLACLARNALNRTPPLGFFKDFVMEKDGKHNNSINLKRRGTAPLTDVIRVHALAVGSVAQNSFDRLRDIEAAGLLPAGKARDIADALEYIAMVRIRHQALDVDAGRTPDNNIEPEHLSSFDKRNLKEAFQVVSNAQNFLKFKYTASRGVQ